MVEDNINKTILAHGDRELGKELDAFKMARLARNDSPDPSGNKLLAKIAGIAPMSDEDTGKPTWRMKAKVKSVREELSRYYTKDGEDVERAVSVGWFAHFEGSREAVFLGRDEPGLKAGDEVEIVIRKQ